jgi:ATP-dependent DNA helicase RecG
MLMTIDIASLDLNKLFLKDLLQIARGKDNEGEILELKDDILKPAIISDYIAQFSNNRGGLLIFGLNDDGTPSGKIKHYDKTNEISIQEGVLATTPSVAIEIKSFQVPDRLCWVVAVKIPKPADGIPRLSSSGALVKRVGSRRAIIQPLGYSFESQILGNASAQDLDESSINLFFYKLKSKAPYIRDDKESVLQVFQLLRPDGSGVIRPTNAGMILFGKSPDVWVDGTRVNVIRYATLEVSSNIEDSAVFAGPIVRTIEDVDKKVWNLIRKPSFLISGKRHEITEYPYLAIREAIHNAFFHNDYQVSGNIFIEIFPNRLEIRNMGVPLGGTRLQDLVGKPKHRNRILLKVLSEMGFVEGWGIGLRTMLDNLRTSGLPEPILHVEAEETRLCFHTHAFLDAETLGWIQQLTSKTQIEINFRQILAIAYAKHKGKITNAIYQKINGVTTHVAGNELRELCSSGLFIQLGRGKSAYYTLTELFNTDEKRLEKYFPKEVILKLRKPQIKILSMVETFDKINAKQIFYQSGYSDERGIKRTLNGLVRLDLIKRVGKSSSDPSAYYEINKQYHVQESPPIFDSPKQLEMF